MDTNKPSITPGLVIQLILVVVIIPFLPLLISQAVGLVGSLAVCTASIL